MFSGYISLEKINISNFFLDKAIVINMFWNYGEKIKKQAKGQYPVLKVDAFGPNYTVKSNYYFELIIILMMMVILKLIYKLFVII